MVPVEQITALRLAKWSQRLNDNHATPFALFGMGHDHAQGTLVVCVPDEPEITMQLLCVLLRSTLQTIEGQIAEGN